jgi:L-ascorbate metabolism protein UlaG (beta-lactamase superfamily)
MNKNGELPDNTIWHLIQSSFLLKLDGKVMIFDYSIAPGQISENSSLQTGVIRPEKLINEEVYVFVSHGHEDHFNPVIFDWGKRISGIHYLLSYDLPKYPVEATILRPNEEKTEEDIRVRSYPSTDDGLAYSIYVQGKHIYFSGDNAFWNWDGDLDDDIYERIALSGVDGETPMDIAFQVCDPRLDGMGDGGIHIFAHKFQPKLLVPIHSFGEYGFNALVEKRLRESGFENTYWCVGGRGDSFSIE